MTTMKTPFAIAIIGTLALSSCTTTYDRAGRPVQSVSPGGVAVAALAAGAVGYAIADNNNDRHKDRNRKDYRRYNDNRNSRDGRYYDNRRRR